MNYTKAQRDEIRSKAGESCEYVLDRNLLDDLDEQEAEIAGYRKLMALLDADKAKALGERDAALAEIAGYERIVRRMVDIDREKDTDYDAQHKEIATLKAQRDRLRDAAKAFVDLANSETDDMDAASCALDALRAALAACAPEVVPMQQIKVGGVDAVLLGCPEVSDDACGDTYLSEARELGGEAGAG